MPRKPRVTVVRKSGRRFLQLRYRDRTNGREITKSSETTILREAERAASRWEERLLAGEFAEPGQIEWLKFVDKYDSEHLPSLAESSAEKAHWSLDKFHDLMRPGNIGAITAMTLSRFQSELRTEGLAETTIASILGTLRAALNWAKSIGLLRSVPQFPKVQRSKTGSRGKMMKGRPITDAEFKKMLAAVPKIVGESRADEWRYYLRGLWLSGLRLSESIQLWWDRDDRLSVDMTGRRPMLRIAAEHEKGNRDRLLPMAPEFAEFLDKTSKSKRTGPVFEITREKAPGERPSKWWVSHVVSQIGKQAGIVVDSRGPKYASAHDLRRSFGERWARKVMPQVLMELMRHEAIETTMRFYVGRNAETTADVLWTVAKQEKGDT